MGVKVSDFLSAFFPHLDEAIHIRALKAKGAIESNENKPVMIQLTRRELADNLNTQHYIRNLNKTRGLYFIPNAGGAVDKAITRFNAVFCERDDLPLIEQHALLDTAPLQTSARVETLKSVHAYWFVDGDCSESEWRELQVRLIAYFKSDPTIKNPSRLMRLPNLNHVSVNGDGGLHYKRVEIVQFAPERRYTVQQLFEAFPPVSERAHEQSSSNGNNGQTSGQQVFDSWDELNAELKRRIMRHPTVKQNQEGIYHCRAACHESKGDTAIMFNPATGAVKCLKGCSHAALLQSLGLPEYPDGNSSDKSSKAKDSSDAALEQLRILSPEPSAIEIESALREFAARLAGCDALEREMAREEAIKILKSHGCSSPARIVDTAMPKPELNQEKSRGLVLNDPDLWPDPVNGAELLNAIIALFCRFISASKEAIAVAALWVLYAHAHDAFEVSPLLTITSPEKRCGKTTLLMLIGALVPRALTTSNITASALFRTVEKYKPTLLIDEADSFMTDDESLRGILNSGHRRANAYVVRTVGQDYEPQIFATWCPKVIALIGTMPDTIEDRSIMICMQRKHAGDIIEELRLDRVSEFEPLRQQAARWAADTFVILKAADPQLPDSITNARARDNWRVLVAVADAAGDNWPEHARATAQSLAGCETVSESARVLLLNDLRELFDELGDRITSDEIVQRLVEIEGRPWAEWSKGRPISKTGLARLLKPFGIRPTKWRDVSLTLRGYVRSDFEDVFARYLEIETPQTPHAAESIAYSETETPQAHRPVAFDDDVNSTRTKDVADVAFAEVKSDREVFEI
ncbi:MAG: DUF3631 domain-containing protein [Blastocatellia bacterium]